MITRFDHQGVQWIDLESPTPDEVDQVAQEFDLTSFLSQDLLAPTVKGRVDLYPRVAYAVLHFPASRHTRGLSRSQEVDFVIGDRFMVTAHYDAVPAVYDFARAFEAEMLLKHAATPGFGSGHILLQLAERLYGGVENELESLEDTINAIEREIFSGNEKEMVVVISQTTRELLHHKRTLENHGKVLDTLEQMTIMTFGESYGNYLRGVKLFHSRVLLHAVSLMETIQELRETNTALLSTRQNEIMKNLTIMTFITAPLALIATLFGMSSPHVPLVGNPQSFWIIISGMLVFVAFLFGYFKYKKWL